MKDARSLAFDVLKSNKVIRKLGLNFNEKRIKAFRDNGVAVVVERKVDDTHRSEGICSDICLWIY